MLERPHRVDIRVLALDDADLVAVGLRVGLAAADAEPETLVGLGDVLDVEGDELAAAERRPEAEQEQGPVAGAGAGGGSQLATRRRRVAVRTASFWAGAVPRRRRIPWTTWRTSQSAVGGGTWPASWWTWLMAASRRWMVDAALPLRARWVT